MYHLFFLIMKKHLIVILTLSYSIYTNAQNLIQKPNKDLYSKNGFFLKTNGELFSGLIPDINDNEIKLSELEYKKGIKHGKASYYYNESNIISCSYLLHPITGVKSNICNSLLSNLPHQTPRILSG